MRLGESDGEEERFRGAACLVERFHGLVCQHWVRAVVAAGKRAERDGPGVLLGIGHFQIAIRRMRAAPVIGLFGLLPCALRGRESAFGLRGAGTQSTIGPVKTFPEQRRLVAVLLK